LSVERPFVGAFAVHIPRAMSPHRNGLVRAVLPASVRTRANGQLRFPRNLGDPRGNAPHDTDCITGADPPMAPGSKSTTIDKYLLGGRKCAFICQGRFQTRPLSRPGRPRFQRAELRVPLLCSGLAQNASHLHCASHRRETGTIPDRDQHFHWYFTVSHGMSQFVIVQALDKQGVR
jgi:hypothetical protein